MKKWLVICLLSFSFGLLLISFLASANQTNLSNYYASPSGNYTKVRLVNNGSITTSTFCNGGTNAGTIFADSTTGYLEICKADGSVASYPGNHFNRFGTGPCPALVSSNPCPANYTAVSCQPFAIGSSAITWSCGFTGSGTSTSKSGCFSIWGTGGAQPAYCNPTSGTPSAGDPNAYDMGCDTIYSNTTDMPTGPVFKRNCCFNESTVSLSYASQCLANCNASSDPIRKVATIPAANSGTDSTGVCDAGYYPSPAPTYLCNLGVFSYTGIGSCPVDTCVVPQCGTSSGTWQHEGTACTGTAGTCSSGDYCTVSDICAVDTCNATYACGSTAGTWLHEGTACTATPGSCSSGDYCNASDTCAIDTCNATYACGSTAGTWLHEGTACTATPGSCSSGDYCNASDTCAIDTCNATYACGSTAGTWLHEGTACTATPGSCSSGDYCNASDTCAIDTCNATYACGSTAGTWLHEGTACTATPGSCSSGDYCNASDTCAIDTCNATYACGSTAGTWLHEGTACTATPGSCGAGCCTSSDTCSTMVCGACGGCTGGTTCVDGSCQSCTSCPCSTDPSTNTCGSPGSCHAPDTCGYCNSSGPTSCTCGCTVDACTSPCTCADNAESCGTYPSCNTCTTIEGLRAECYGNVCYQAESTCRDVCFIAGTKVLMSDGRSKWIEKIKKGDLIRGSNGINKVVDTIVHTGDSFVLYSINNGPYFVTESHPFMTTKGWKSFNPQATKRTNPQLKVTALSVGDELVILHGTVRLNRIRSSKVNTRHVYNFSVEGSHDYYANGYLVHNKALICFCPFDDPVCPCTTVGGCGQNGNTPCCAGS